MPSFVFEDRKYGVSFVNDFFCFILRGRRSYFVSHRRIWVSSKDDFMSSYSDFCCSMVYPQVSVGSIRYIMRFARYWSASMACISILFFCSIGRSRSPGVSITCIFSSI